MHIKEGLSQVKKRLDHTPNLSANLLCSLMMNINREKQDETNAVKSDSVKVLWGETGFSNYYTGLATKQISLFKSCPLLLS